jgi:cytoskeleton protein RodZ
VATLTSAPEEEVAVGSTEEDEQAAPTGDEDAPLPQAGLPAAPALPEAPRLETAATSQPAGTESVPSTPSSADEGRVVLHARLASWVQITDAAGQPIVTRTLQAGESLDVPLRPGLTLFTGNAGGLEVVVDGRPLPALGPVGAVRRDISLDPDQLRGGQEVE